MSETMVEKVAKAIDAVQIWSRFNDWTSDRVEGFPVEICRYGKDGEDEIVVLKRLSAVKDVGDALREVVSEMRARAAIEAMREPSWEMMQAMYEAMFMDKWDGSQAPMVGAGFEAAIDAALSSSTRGE